MTRSPADPRLLVGQWSLRRVVTDERAGLSGSVTGALQISVLTSGLSWIEAGELSWNGAQAPITRQLELRPSASGWEMYFAHGGHFHEWAPGRDVEHQCLDDRYVGMYRVTADRMDVLWTVTGPAKKHRYVTVFER